MTLIRCFNYLMHVSNTGVIPIVTWSELCFINDKQSNLVNFIVPWLEFRNKCPITMRWNKSVNLFQKIIIFHYEEKWPFRDEIGNVIGSE